MKYSRNILPQKEIFGKKLRATGKNVLPQGEISCDRKKFPVTEENFSVTGKKFLSQEEIPCHRKKLPVEG